MLLFHHTLQRTVRPMEEQEKIDLQKKYDAYRELVGKQRDLKQDGQRLTEELSSQGLSENLKLEEFEGLGDLVHAALNRLGITEERFKQILGLQECNCSKRRKMLNKLVPFFKAKDNGK